MKRWLEAWWRAAVCLALACGGDGDEDEDDRPHTCGRDGDIPPQLQVAWSRPAHEYGVVAVAPDGAVVVGLVGLPEDPPACAGLAKLAPAGNRVWTRPFDPDEPPDPAFEPCPPSWHEIAIDGDGNILAIGVVRSVEVADDSSLAVVRKHDPEGNLLWTYYQDITFDQAFDVAATADGDVLATGADLDVAWLTRLGPAGAVRWTWTDPAYGPFIAVEADPTGRAIVAVEHAPGILAIDAGGAAATLQEVDGWQVSFRTSIGALAVDADGAVLFVFGDRPHLWKVTAEGAVTWKFDLEPPAGPLVDRRGCPFETRVTHIAAAPDRSVQVAYRVRVDLEDYSDGDDIGPDPDLDVAMVAAIGGDGQLDRLAVDWKESSPDDLAVGPDGEIALLMVEEGVRLLALVPAPEGP